MNTIQRIELERLANTRDLGGLSASGGTEIRPGRLIRSGTLYSMSEKDADILTGSYGLKTIIDFRTSTERTEKPDPVLPGVTNHHVPIMEDVAVGITHDKKSDDKSSFDHTISLLMSQGIDPVHYMQNVYRELVEGAHSKAAFRTFFNLLLSQDAGASLWHCSAGKDRVGTGTALLLSALGVDRDIIIKDYLMTGTFLKNESDNLLDALRAKGTDEFLIECVDTCMGVREEYILSVFRGIEETSGSVEAYLHEQIGLTPEKQNELKALYLR